MNNTPVIAVAPLSTTIEWVKKNTIFALRRIPFRVVQAEKAKAVKGKEGAPPDGEKDAHELLRTLVRRERLPHMPHLLRNAFLLLPNMRVSYDSHVRPILK